MDSVAAVSSAMKVRGSVDNLFATTHTHWALALAALLSLTLLFSQWSAEPFRSAPVRELPALKPQPGSIATQAAPITLPATAYQLMGSQLDSEKTAINLEQLPQTRLQLLLKGVFHGSDETAVGAVITGKSGPSFYPLGAPIDEGVVLKQVLANAVVLEREGFPEVLEFGQQWSHQAVSNKAPALNTAAPPSEQVVENPSPGLDQRLQQWRRASQGVEQ